MLREITLISSVAWKRGRPEGGAALGMYSTFSLSSLPNLKRDRQIFTLRLVTFLIAVARPHGKKQLKGRREEGGEREGGREEEGREVGGRRACFSLLSESIQSIVVVVAKHDSRCHHLLATWHLQSGSRE